MAITAVEDEDPDDFKCIHGISLKKCEDPAHQPDPNYVVLPSAEVEARDPDSWMPKHDRLPPHDSQVEKCDCTTCLVERLSEGVRIGQARRMVQAIAHDLDAACNCDTCDEVRRIRDMYKG